MTDLVKYARESDLRNDPLVIDLCDRIESLEADRDDYRQDSFTGQAMHAQWQERAERLEARLARAADDSMAGRIKDVLMQKRMHVNTSGGKQWADAFAVLAEFRAVAADEQEAHVCNPSCRWSGECPAAAEQEAGL